MVAADEQESAARQEPVIRRVVDTGALPAIRWADDGLRVFAIAAGVLARYREGGTLELTCSCVRINPVEEMQASALPLGCRGGGRSL